MGDADQPSTPQYDAATLHAVQQAVRAVEAMERAWTRDDAADQSWEDALISTMDAAPAIALWFARRAGDLAQQAVKVYRRSPAGRQALDVTRATVAVLEESYVPETFDYIARARAAEQVQQAIHITSDFSLSYYRRDLSANGPWEAIVWCYRAALVAAYPIGFWTDYERLRARDPAGLETAIRFLEADPWFFRSGYDKADLLHAIKRLDLTPEQVERLQEVILKVVDGRDRREFRSYCRLACKVDSPALRDALQQRLESNDLAVRRRAGWVLNYTERTAESFTPGN